MNMDEIEKKKRGKNFIQLVPKHDYGRFDDNRAIIRIENHVG